MKHLLFIDDDPVDVDLTVLQLRRAGLEVEYGRAWSRPTMEDALASRSWDAVLCDNSMPGFSGAAALELHKASGCQAPFLIFSGSVDPRLAAELERDGAARFMHKDDIQGLVFVLSSLGSNPRGVNRGGS